MRDGKNFISHFLAAFEAPVAVCPFELPVVRRCDDILGGGWGFVLPIGRGVSVGELEWTGRHDEQIEITSPAKLTWIAILFSGDCNLIPLADSEVHQVQSGRCAIFRGPSAALQWRGGPTVRSLLYSFTPAAWDLALARDADRGAGPVSIRLADSFSLPPTSLGQRLAFLTERLSSQSPLDQASHLDRIACYHDWLAEFFRHLTPANASHSTDSTKKIAEIARYFDSHFDEALSLAEISRRFHINEFALKQGFREVLGTTVFGYRRAARLRAAEALLRDGQLPVLEVATRVGFSNPSHFARLFKEYSGLLPKDFARMRSGEKR